MTDNPQDAIGLCATCQHARHIANRRGSVFLLCEKAIAEPETFARYPRLPLHTCIGYVSVGSAPPRR